MRLVVVLVGRVVGLGVLGMEVGLGVFCWDDFGLTFPGTENVIRKLVMFWKCWL